jgi:hypothetical protein
MFIQQPQYIFITRDILLQYVTNSAKVHTASRNCVYIALLLATCSGFCEERSSGNLRIHREKQYKYNPLKWQYFSYN